MTLELLEEKGELRDYFIDWCEHERHGDWCSDLKDLEKEKAMGLYEEYRDCEELDQIEEGLTDARNRLIIEKKKFDDSKKVELAKAGINVTIPVDPSLELHLDR